MARRTVARRALQPFRVVIIGAGKVGMGIARALRASSADVEIRALRKGLPRTPIDADLLVLAVREGALAALCERLIAAGITRRTAVVHCAGMLGPEALAPLRTLTAGVAQMHPMLSFASRRVSPPLVRGHLHVDGDRLAIRAARHLARLLGMSARTFPRLDRAAYHAAAGIVANGAASLGAVGIELLVQAGVPRKVAPAMLGPLLASVAHNIERLGLPDALTGPVRRGDALAVARHQAVFEKYARDHVPLYRALARTQLALAKRLGDGPTQGFEAIERFLADPHDAGRTPSSADDPPARPSVST